MVDMNLGYFGKAVTFSERQVDALATAYEVACKDMGVSPWDTEYDGNGKKLTKNQLHQKAVADIIAIGDCEETIFLVTSMLTNVSGNEKARRTKAYRVIRPIVEYLNS